MRNPNSKFKEEYQQILIEMMSEGKSVAEFCAEAHIGKTTFYEWLDKYPSFSNAYDLGLAKSEAYYSSVYKEKLMSFEKGFDFQALRFLMANRFGTSNKRVRSMKWFDPDDLYKSLRNLHKKKRYMSAEDMQDSLDILLGAAKLRDMTELVDRIKKLEVTIAEQT